MANKKPLSDIYKRRMTFNDGEPRSYICYLRQIIIAQESIHLTIEKIDESDMMSEIVQIPLSDDARLELGRGKARTRFNPAQDAMEEGFFDVCWKKIEDEYAEWLAYSEPQSGRPPLNPTIVDV